MNLNTSQYEVDTLSGKLCAIFSCDRITVVKIQSVKYIKFKDIQIHEFEREGFPTNNEKLDLDMYRCLLCRVWYTYYANVLNDDD